MYVADVMEQVRLLNAEEHTVRASVKILRVAGIPIRVHWTLSLALLYLSLAMALRVHALRGSALSPGDGAWGLLFTVALLASVLGPEIARALIARAQGAAVRSITLMLFGAVCQIEGLPSGRRREACVAMTGPAVSLAIAAAAYAGGALCGPIGREAGLLLRTLGEVNLARGALSLVPALPLDGGRVLRALLGSYDDGTRANDLAVRMGVVAALALVGAGLVAGSPLALGFGFFIGASVAAESRAYRTRRASEAVPVLAALDLRAPCLDADNDTVERAAALMSQTGSTHLLVRDAEGRIGVIVAAQVARVPAHERSLRRAGDWTRYDVPLVPAHASLNDALTRMARAGFDAAAVLLPTGGAALVSHEDLALRLGLRGLNRVVA